MSLLTVLTEPDIDLHKVSKPIDDFTPELQELIDNMVETMYEEDGVGLAAPQIGQLKRLVVIDVSDTRDQPRVLINTEILEKEGETGIEEGCLSIPEIRAFVPRAEKVKVRSLDRHGKPYEFEADELLAICIQHEIDHLDGKLFIDYLSPLKRRRIEEKLKKIKKYQQRNNR